MEGIFFEQRNAWSVRRYDPGGHRNRMCPFAQRDHWPRAQLLHEPSPSGFSFRLCDIFRLGVASEVVMGRTPSEHPNPH